MPKHQIREFAKSIQIPYLIHFTRTDNLASILQHGIYPVDKFGEISTNPIINDLLRLDGHLDGVSISITFPNCQMFYKYRKADPVVSWSVLVIKPAILWKKDCAFCKHNAADGRMICQPLAVLKTPQSLRDIYCEIDGFRSRDAQRLKEYDPTDVQAEVLVFDKIEPEYIAAVVFDSNEAKNNFAEQVGDRKTHVHPPNKGLFATRTYVREYC